MKNPVRSAKAPSKQKGNLPDLPNTAGQDIPEISDSPSRQEIRQEVHRTNVPRQSQRPVERSNQSRRSGKP